MSYAEVSVNSPAAQRRTFSYAVPPRLNVQEGQAVMVPFGQKTLQGIVMELTPLPAVEDTREILGTIETEPVLSKAHISLARWISEYYLSPLFSAVALMLPPGFERKAMTFVSPAKADVDVSTFDDDEKRVFELVGENGRIAAGKLEKTLGKKKAQTIISAMVKRGILARSYELGPVKVKPKSDIYIGLNPNTNTDGLTPKQASLIDFLQKQNKPVLWVEAAKATGCSRAIANTLEKKNLVNFRQVEVRREPISYEKITPSYPLTMTDHQKSACDSIKAALSKISNEPVKPDVFLLHGVTGSGKTEVYLQALAEAVRLGKKGIVLVPEIALTPQTIERFAARFPHRVAVLHSKLSLGEQYDEWHRIKQGQFDVVIGSRSAIFAPQPNLGIIVIDEEHEWTYKQDVTPHYHARDAAIKLAELTGATVVLGSATPDIESYYRAQKDNYKLLSLPERVVPFAGAALPGVEVVDMREELYAGNRSIFSRSLLEAVNEAVAAEEQVILFLNRRGGATFVQCRKCGFVVRCRRCETPLVQHITENTLRCHQCNYRIPVPTICPSCSSNKIKFFGLGTQKLEQEVRNTFPRARHLRWDSDTTGGRTSDEEILHKFRNREAEILIGTQMVAKGHDIPSVTLVGVISADTSLNLPDFRAGERTFQLLSQVAGRAGRGQAGGKVIVQTYSPEHYAIQAASRHDYASFYKEELTYRRQLHNPPFTRLARLMFTHTNDAACRNGAERMKDTLIAERDAKGIGDIEIIGPAPAYIPRLRGRYRWQIIVRGSGISAFLSGVPIPQGWAVDIDPAGVIQ